MDNCKFCKNCIDNPGGYTCKVLKTHCAKVPAPDLGRKFSRCKPETSKKKTEKEILAQNQKETENEGTQVYKNEQ